MKKTNLFLKLQSLRNLLHMESLRARSKNVKLPVEWNTMGQPLNNKGGNTLVSYIGVLVRHNVSITFSSWTDVRLNLVKGRIWADIIATFDICEEHNHYILKSVSKAIRQFRTDADKCLRDAVVDVNLKPPTKYANLIDEADYKEFVTTRT
ncbi:hypothetical protein Lal_00012581 [Lupinus albus]|nr:hypothetical protein Lal_00012581 [Lupinus albus]